MIKITRVSPTVALATSAAVLGCALASACARSTGSPANYFEVRLEADAPNVAECHEAVAVRFEPANIDKEPAGSPYQTDTYTDQPQIVGKPVADGPDNWECQFTYKSRDLAPGTWRIVGEFSSGTQSCVREIRPGRSNRVRLDQEDGCVEFDADSGQP
jgi:hypothetical protein